MSDLETTKFSDEPQIPSQIPSRKQLREAREAQERAQSQIESNKEPNIDPNREVNKEVNERLYRKENHHDKEMHRHQEKHQSDERELPDIDQRKMFKKQYEASKQHSDQHHNNIDLSYLKPKNQDADQDILSHNHPLPSRKHGNSHISPESHHVHGSKRRKLSQKERTKLEIIGWVKAIVLAVVLALTIRTFVFEVKRIEGPSMNDTLISDEYVAVTKLGNLIGDYQRGNIVICRFPGRSGTFVKRVVAVGGDIVEIKGGVTYLNSNSILEPFVTYAATENYGPVTIADGEYLVMGDNRAVSHDGRSADVGTLPKSSIVGKVQGVLWPLSNIRLISD